MDKAKLCHGHSSTYGQACMQCYKAKCRCVPTSSGAGCERCLRLRKQCQPSDSTRRRNAQRTEDSDARIARLEGQIETLLSAMNSMASPSVSLSGINQVVTERSNSASTSSSKFTPPATSSEIKPGTESGRTLGTGAPRATLAQINPFSPPRFSLFPSDISPDQAAERLEFFRFRMLPCFPFINLGSDITASQLHKDRPFLFQAILTVTTFSTQKKLALAEDLKRNLFTFAFLNVQSNTDLLLALLTYIAWSTDPFLGGADLLSRLMMLAISLVYDLRLFKPSPPDVKLMMTITQGRTYEIDDMANEETVQDLLEKQRAVLACFILSSNISSHLGRLDTLRWTPQMEEALRVISINKSCPTDQFFSFLVRLQLLKQRAAYIREQHEIDRTRSAIASVTASVPGLLYLKTLQGQLHELISSFPSHLHQKDILIIHAQHVRLYISQLAYSISHDSPLLNLSGHRSDGGLLPGFERLECLWQSVESIKSWLDCFHNIPPSELVGLPFHFWSQMILCMTTLKYLSVLEDPAWDRQAVRNTIDIMPSIQCVSQKLELTSEEPGLQCEENLFKLLAKMLDKCRVWAESRLDMSLLTQDRPPGSGQTTDCETAGHNSYIPDLDQMVWIQSIDLENDQWLEEALGGPPVL